MLKRCMGLPREYSGRHPDYVGRVDYAAFNTGLCKLNTVKLHGSVFTDWGVNNAPWSCVHCDPALIPLFILRFSDSIIHLFYLCVYYHLPEGKYKT